MLKKKHNAIAYHRVREAIAAGITKFAHVRSTANIADVLTKPLASDAFHNLIKPILFRQAPSFAKTRGGLDQDPTTKGE
jgi:adenosylcobinamide amidohydrolase